MKNIIFYVLFLFPILGQSQTIPNLNPTFNTEQKAVFQVIMNVFNGMQKGDSSLVKSSFTNNPQAFTIYFKDNQVQHKKDDIQKFYDAIGTPHDKVWNEYTWNYDVKIDGELAHVWCEYAFYIDDQFSHCGVDAFQLVKQKDTWKIFVLSDTRRKDDCDIPAIENVYTPK